MLEAAEGKYRLIFRMAALLGEVGAQGLRENPAVCGAF